MSAQQQKHNRPEKQHSAMMRMRIKSHRARPSGRKLSSSSLLLSAAALPSLLSPSCCSILFRESLWSLSRPPVRTIAAGPPPSWCNEEAARKDGVVLPVSCCFLSSVLVLVVVVDDEVATTCSAPEFLFTPMMASTVEPAQPQETRENTTATRDKGEGGVAKCMNGKASPSPRRSWGSRDEALQMRTLRSLTSDFLTSASNNGSWMRSIASACCTNCAHHSDGKHLNNAARDATSVRWLTLRTIIQ
jgi:hypothetical protein